MARTDLKYPSSTTKAAQADDARSKFHFDCFELRWEASNINRPLRQSYILNNLPFLSVLNSVEYGGNLHLCQLEVL